jgi:hypothetical protein
MMVVAIVVMVVWLVAVMWLAVGALADALHLRMSDRSLDATKNSLRLAASDQSADVARLDNGGGDTRLIGDRGNTNGVDLCGGDIRNGTRVDTPECVGIGNSQDNS